MKPKMYLSLATPLHAVVAFILALAMLAVAPFEGYAAPALTGRDLHIDVPLSNIAVAAFEGGDFIGQELFPVVPVGKQSNKYYTITKANWLRLPTSTLRAPGTPPNRVEWAVSSDSYFASNYALAGEVLDEDRANSDDPIQLEQNTTMFVTEMLQRDREVRIANKVSSISNVGSGVVLAGGDRWSQFGTSSPLSDITTGHAFIRSQTGVIANLAVIDWDTLQMLRRHPELLDMFKYTSGGQLTDEQLMTGVFKVQRVLVANSVKNTANEGQAATMANIWPNMFGLFYVNPARQGLKTVTFGLGFRWTDPQLGVPFAVRRYRDKDEGTKKDVLDCQYYQDEKTVAQQLSYVVKTTL